ncbi:hypothetical protein JO379_000282 [Streptomyces syringium]|uniref:eCIS core domain-containing protein n=1 Tax=Streptomyces syringium TaxID=76729 RepID=A0ABS4XYN0_9ACTN|nr:hypothetical protein [Streptomyces syringium]
MHTGPEADALARWLGAEAFTVGADIFFRAGHLAPGSRRGRVLLAHEIAHTLQPDDSNTGRDRVATHGHWRETAARQAGASVGAGGQCLHPGPAAARRTDPRRALLVCRHSSWEHRMLGECNTGKLDAIALAVAKKDGTSGAYLRKIRQYVELWRASPEEVTEERIKEHFPDVRAIRMPGSGLLVTYGELNTLADYLPQPAVLDAQPKSVLLPILQTVRQETYNKIGKDWLLNASSANFEQALVNWQWGSFWEKILETSRMNDLTKGVGEQGVGHYYGLLARNACHFAPYAWHRWYQFHLIARDYAKRSYDAREGEGGENRYKALLYNGYADHFLQDAFAAGHLVNKTLVLQWFLDWVADKWIPVAEWDRAKEMTFAKQPGLAPAAMYTEYPYHGVVKDPETGQEESTRQARRDASGIVGNPDSDTAYANWLAFLASGVVQASATAPHDFFNAQSLWVSSVNRSTPYQIWGDDTLLTGGDGVRIAAETAQMSQQAVTGILAQGHDGGITAASIHDRLPSRAGDTADGVTDLLSWHEQVKKKADNQLFSSLRGTYIAISVGNPRLGKVSLDDSY